MSEEGCEFSKKYLIEVWPQQSIQVDILGQLLIGILTARPHYTTKGCPRLLTTRLKSVLLSVKKNIMSHEANKNAKLQDFLGYGMGVDHILRSSYR